MELSQQTSGQGQIAAKMGLMLALIKILFSTVQFNYFMGQWTMNMIMTLVSVLLSLTVLVVLAVQVRKANGGYISFGLLFRALFIAILIGCSLSYFFDLLYIHFLDPSIYDQLKQSTISFAGRFGADEAALDEIAAKFDEEQAKALTLGRITLGLSQTIIFHSIAGFILAAIFKKKNPMQPTGNPNQAQA